MTIAELRNICLSFPAVTEDIKWEDHLCFSVGNKMFIVTGPDNVPVTASFKTSDEDFNVLQNRQGFIPAPYMAHNKWIFVDDISRFSKKEWESYLQKSYTIIASKLSLKLQREIASGKIITKATPKKKKATTKKKVVAKKKSTKKSARKKSR